MAALERTNNKFEDQLRKVVDAKVDADKNKLSDDVVNTSGRGLREGDQGGVGEVVQITGKGVTFADMAKRGPKKQRKRKQRGDGKGKKGGESRFEFLADSHGRGLSKFLTGAEVHFKPGARMERVVDGVGREGTSCTVIMGGTNDISVDGVRSGLKKLREKVGNNRRVVMVGVPPRHDEIYPNVNDLIYRKNELIQNFCGFYGYTYLNVDDSDIYFYSRDGLHFNVTGKRWLANKIQTAVNFL